MTTLDVVSGTPYQKIRSFCCVPGMALIQLEINQPQVFTAKCNEPQVVVSDGKNEGSGVVIPLSVRNRNLI